MNYKRDAKAYLMSWKKSKLRKPLIIRGARQVGKTFLLKEFAQNNFKKFHYLNFEEEKALTQIFTSSLNPKKILKAYFLATGIKVDLHKDLLILDEIQACPLAITALKYFEESFPSGFVIAAGSLLGLELSETSYPVGKVDLIDIYPLTFIEFLDAANRSELAQYIQSIPIDLSIPEPVHERIWESLLEYMVVGGLPESVKVFLSNKDRLEGLEQSRSVQKQVITLYNADFAKHAGKENAMHISRVFEEVAMQLAQAVDSSVGKFRFKNVISKQGRYSECAGPIDWLSKASLIHKCQIVNAVKIPLKSFTKENVFKLYMFDVGVLGAMVSLSPHSILAQDYGSFKGFFAENFVAQELMAYANNSLFSWRGRTSEIEFLIERKGRIFPLEVKAGKNIRSKSLSVYRKQYFPEKSFIYSARQTVHLQDGNIQYLPLYAVKNSLLLS